ncbi:Uncharacterised protein [Candidatus Bilamarchaeum dharawalense]|uniref:Uncharacterized protein n=1 Tax=Candidatus Bilamarchaeum dharawalense TaxID=2885759 RepID=A0A5E4LKK7_9ARCH|nr:Uncharacterised protein [Candidatus Bilamarchaeum dharawalense]
MKLLNFIALILILGLASAETAPLQVIAVDSGPAGYGTPSVSGVTIYMRNPATGGLVDSHTTNTAGAMFYPTLGSQFYVTTAGPSGSALGGTYGFIQELDGQGVPSFTITKNGSIYALCRVSTGECSYTTSSSMLILYKIHESTGPQPQNGGEILCIGESITKSGHTVKLDNIIKPATPVDKAKFTITPSNWDPTLNIDGITHIYTGNGYNLTIQVFSSINDCVEIKFDVTQTNTGFTDLSCTDNDNGDNRYVKGSVTYFYKYNGNPNTYTYTDYCKDSDTVSESFCVGTTPNIWDRDCPSGYACSDGACVQDTGYDCTSTDEANGAYNIYVQGTRTVNGITATDYCNGDYLVETYCSGDTGYTTTVSCPTGYSCSNGACTQNSQQCSDSDASNTLNSLFVKGTTTGLNPDGYYIVAKDACSSDTQVVEYVCQNNVVVPIDSDGTFCPSGYTCSDGACVAQTNGCYDNDGGRDIYTASSSYNSNNEWGYDVCYNSNIVKEYYCNGNSMTYAYLNCPSGYVCSNNSGMTGGRCVYSTQNSCTDADGQNYYKQSTVNYNGQSYTDYCNVNNQVVEYSCVNGMVSTGYFPCPSGYSCSDGACTYNNGLTKYKVYVADKKGNYFDYLSGNVLVQMKEKSTNNVIQEIYTSKHNVDPNKYAEFDFPIGQDVYFEASLGNQKYGGLLSPVYNCDPAHYSQKSGEYIKFYVNGYWTATEISNSTVLEPSSCSETEEYYTVELKTGWNLLSVPLSSNNEAEVVSTTCDVSKAYIFDPNTKSYLTTGYGVGVGDMVLVPNSFWVKTDSPCKIQFKGVSENTYQDGWSVRAGWVGFGGPYSNTNWESMSGDCEVLSGPWRFDSEAWMWKKATTIKPGEGYFVKVKNSCTLGGSSSLPPALPG